MKLKYISKQINDRSHIIKTQKNPLNNLNKKNTFRTCINFAAQSTLQFSGAMNQQTEDLKIIREMMEKSTKFLSLSGLSGVIAGTAAIAGAAFVYFYLLRDPGATDYNLTQEALILLTVASIVLIISIGAAILLSLKKARKGKQKIQKKVVLTTLYHLGLPLLTGGIFSLILLFRGEIALVAASTLLFYGLALINVSKFTFPEIHYLGITQIFLGILAAIFMYYGILFWTIGFGICHILYGLLMYFRYDYRKV
jgi:predicted lysophospholipase L1 biosynthesis ABC-type transport system permease subunit